MSIRIGVDVGGTNTDAVVVSGHATVLGFAKVSTSSDVTTGVSSSITQALSNACTASSAVKAVMLGTTHFVNACIQRRGLARVGVLRLCGAATQALPPFSDMPPGIREAVGGYYAFLSGGFEYDGQQEIGPIKASEVAAFVGEALARGVSSLAVCGVFSPVNARQEEEVGELLRREWARRPGAPPLDLSLSHSIGQLGLLERENAAILNAALLPLARQVVAQCQRAVRDAGMAAPLFFTSNDGTLMSAQEALQTPVATFQSGPVNSLRGATALCGPDLGAGGAVVLDIGGTTTDVGVLGAGGMPRPAPREVQFAGVPTNFQMPDVFSIGLGGGSLVQWHGSSADLAAGQGGHAKPVGSGGFGGACSVGPDSVGNQLLERALCMGGDTPTATDVAVLLGRMQLGSEAAVKQQLPSERAQQAWRAMQQKLAWCVEWAKTHKGDLPVIVVGGGAPLCGDALEGAQSMAVPPHAAVANAVGAAIPQVCGTVDAVFQLGDTEGSRRSVLQQVEQQAVQRAVAAGAILDTCQVVSYEQVPLAYLPGNTARVRVKVVGNLDLEGAAPARARYLEGAGPGPSPGSPGTGIDNDAASTGRGGAEGALDVAAEVEEEGRREMTTAAEGEVDAGYAGGFPAGQAAARVSLEGRGDELGPAELAAWQPQVDGQGEWVLGRHDLHLLSIGCGILGTGGGGSPGKATLKAVMELQRTGLGSIRVVLPDAIPPGSLVVDGGYMGAPTVSLEKLDSDQAEAAVRAVLRAYYASLPPGQPPPQLAAVMAGEVGGGNGIEPLVLGSRLGIPVVDGDLMGRAFPELQMVTTAIYGLPLTPAALADEKGSSVAVLSVPSAAWLERLLRPVCTEMGCSAGFASRPLTGEQLRQVVVPQTLSLAWRLGHAVMAAQHAKQDPGSAIAAEAGGRVLFRGKVVDVERRTTQGFARGSLLLQPLEPPALGQAGQQGLPAVLPPLPRPPPPPQQQQQQQEEEEEGKEGKQAAAPRQWPGGQHLKILFQNENLVALLGEECIASVPDLICCVELENGLPISTEEMRYGLRVAVVGIPASPLLTTPQGLAAVGPAAFGYRDVQFKTLGEFRPVQPIPGVPSST